MTWIYLTLIVVMAFAMLKMRRQRKARPASGAPHAAVDSKAA